MTEDNELIEQMARAIYEATGSRAGWFWERSILGGKDYWLKLARAAFTAYRNHEVEL